MNELVTAGYFVPCGERPECMNIENVDKMFKSDGQPRFHYIIEGANLFITEEARNVLQDALIILFKYDSTNIGGITSFSIALLATLSFDYEGFREHMVADEDGRFPELY